jgi:tankyrase
MRYDVLDFPLTPFWSCVLNPLLNSALLLSCAAALLSGCGSSLHDAALRGDLDQMRQMLAQDPALANDRDRLDKTPLHRAVSFKQMEVMALLLEFGADINAQDTTGMTPLHVAAMLGRGDEAAWLLEHGADPMARDSFGDTPLHTTAIFGGGKVVKPLLARGADLRVTNQEGLTALDLAQRYDQEKMIQYLEHLAGR